MEQIEILRVVSSDTAAVLLPTGAVVSARFIPMPPQAQRATPQRPVFARASIRGYSMTEFRFMDCVVDIPSLPLPDPSSFAASTTRFRRVLDED
jgi:hypothetical protein